jgi:hypothetical protein
MYDAEIEQLVLRGLHACALAAGVVNLAEYKLGSAHK